MSDEITPADVNALRLAARRMRDATTPDYATSGDLLRLAAKLAALLPPAPADSMTE